MTLDDIISLATAAEELGLSPDTLKRQAQNGRIDARNVGKTWITTKQEVARYRAAQLGRVGRPSPPVLYDRVPWAGQPGAFEVHLLAQPLPPGASEKAVRADQRQRRLLTMVAREVIAAGPDGLIDLVVKVREDPRLAGIPVGFTDTPLPALILQQPR